MSTTTHPPSAAAAPRLQLARCARCAGLSFPPQVPGCRHCGAPTNELHAQDCEGPLRLLNFVTVHTALVPGLPVPAIIGEVALAPDLIEEAYIDVATEDELRLDMPLQAVWLTGETEDAGRWVFRALATEAAQ